MTRKRNNSGTAVRGLANSFKREEVEVMKQFFRILRSGGDIRVLAKNPHLANIERKFLKMNQKLERIISERGSNE